MSPRLGEVYICFLPTSIRAVHLTEDTDWEAVAFWCGGVLVNRAVGDSGELETELLVPGLNGPYPARVGDWVAQGAAGLFFVRDEEFFSSSYQKLT